MLFYLWEINILYVYAEKSVLILSYVFFLWEINILFVKKSVLILFVVCLLSKFFFFIELTLFGMQILCVRFAFKEMYNKELQMHTYVV